MKKVASSVTTIYDYDVAGNLISESESDGTPLRDIVCLNGERIAMRLYGSQAGWYYFVNDHLGIPQKIVNESGVVIWQAAYLPFGKAQVLAGSSITNNFRFPGQYYDAETELYQNWHRYYMPGKGRYLTSDPIGLAGGINLYAYVMNDPVNLIDLYGLFDCKKDFFNQLLEPVTKIAKQYDFDPNYLLAIAAHESGWLGPHAYELNNAFGLTKGGGNNLRFDSFSESVDCWGRTFGSKVAGATSIDDFIDKLQTDMRSQGGRGKYNSRDKKYKKHIRDVYKSILRRRGSPCEGE